MSGIAPKSNLDNGGLTAEEQKDLLGQDYKFMYLEIVPTKRGSGPTITIILIPGNKLISLGVESKVTTFNK